jgi:hypothetical protein
MTRNDDSKTGIGGKGLLLRQKQEVSASFNSLLLARNLRL